MSNLSSLYGFAILRNGIKYDYPFKECLTAMKDVCIETYLALGESDDKTEEAVISLGDLKITPTVWDDNLRSGGLILSQQTNIALNALRDVHGKDAHAWGFYLQCDEIIHERDYDLLKADIEKAELDGCDAISFRYLHFWQSHYQVAINKKWYPQEIRAVKLNSKARSWGDAQSFENTTKVYQSEVIIYHYGHVREEDKYKNKKADILKFYHSDKKMKKYKKREKRFDNMTECIPFYGSHPRVMCDRIKQFGEAYKACTVDNAYILTRDEIPHDFIARINAKKVHQVQSIFEVPIAHRDRMVIVNPNFCQKIWYKIKTPKMMRSKLALPWSADFRLSLMLFEKEISVS